MPEKRNLYQTVTDKIVSAIEAGAGDWQMPWIGFKAGLPHNATTDAEYHGVNVLMLWAEAAFSGYDTNQWASYKQWQSRGVQVRKGEKGTLIVYAGSTIIQDETGEDEARQVRFLKCSHVFNASQVDGWENPEIVYPDLAERIEGAEQFVSATGAIRQHGGDRAFYSPSCDVIRLPYAKAFKDTELSTATENYYAVLLHEMTHWTGGKKRCDRQFGKRFGDQAYAAEELVAELGSAFLCAQLGITNEPRPDHAQYLAHWLEIMKGDKRAIFTAASAATKAAEYLNGLQTKADQAA